MPGASGAPGSSGTSASASGWPSTRSISARASPPGRSSDGCAEAGDDGRFHADGAGAAVEHHVDAAAQVGQHMRGAGRRDMAGAVGRGRHHRAAEGRDQRQRHRMGRHPHGDAVEPGQRQVGHAAIRLFRQHQRQRAGPERLRQRLGGGVEHGNAARRGDVGDMRDQRIEGRAGPWRHRAGRWPRRWRRRRRGRRPSRSGRRPGRLAPGSRPRPRSPRGRPAKPGSPAPRSFSLSRLQLSQCRGYKAADSRSVAQSGSAPRSGRGGRRFKSCHSDQFPADLQFPKTRQKYPKTVRMRAADPYRVWYVSVAMTNGERPWETAHSQSRSGPGNPESPPSAHFGTTGSPQKAAGGPRISQSACKRTPRSKNGCSAPTRDRTSVFSTSAPGR